MKDQHITLEYCIDKRSVRKKDIEKVLRPATLLKKRLWHRCFPVNFAKFLRTLFFTEQLVNHRLKGLWKTKKLHYSSGKSLLYFMIGLHFQETYIGMKLAGL